MEQERRWHAAGDSLSKGAPEGKYCMHLTLTILFRAKGHFYSDLMHGTALKFTETLVDQ